MHGRFCTTLVFSFDRISPNRNACRKKFAAIRIWRRFCADTVVLGEFERFALQDGDSLRFGVQVSECDPVKRHAQVVCTLQKGDAILMQEVVKLGKRAGRLTEKVIVDMGKVSTDMVCALQLITAILLMLEIIFTNGYFTFVNPVLLGQ